MSVETIGVGRTRKVEGSIYLERWIQLDAGTETLYAPVTGDLNILDAQCDTETASSEGRRWYGAPSPGEVDAGESIKTWYGQVVRIPFRFLQASGEWGNLKAEIQGFIELAFPGEIIREANRRLEDKPTPTTPPDAPAKFWIWAIEYD